MDADIESPTTNATAETVDPAEETTTDYATESAPTVTNETFPYGAGERGSPLPARTVRGCLESPARDAANGATGSTDCPECDGETVNGAGLYACADCDWTGLLR